MSFVKNKMRMDEGDTILLYLGYDNLVSLKLVSGSVHQTRYGAIKHDTLIGAPYGKKIECAKGWLYPLHPTAELWTLAVPHRTQILFSTDISMIVLQLQLKPGSIVVEAGTGSGSLSHALIRSVQPTGHLYTFEFHPERCLTVQLEFEQHGLKDYVTVQQRDVCSDGFGFKQEVDAVFLDLPSPWSCIESAKLALCPGGRICTFSPCMEQVQKTCEALQQNGFEDLFTVECLVRPFTVQTVRLEPVEFGDKSFSVAGEHQMCKLGGDSHCEPLPKMVRTAHLEVNDLCEYTTNSELGTVISGQNTETSKCAMKPEMIKIEKKTGYQFKTAAPPLAMQGHTGFLTFAALY